MVFRNCMECHLNSLLLFSVNLTNQNSKQCRNFKSFENENICLFTIQGDGVYKTILSKPICKLQISVRTPSSPVREREREREREGGRERKGEKEGGREKGRERERKRERGMERESIYFKRNDGCLGTFQLSSCKIILATDKRSSLFCR